MGQEELLLDGGLLWQIVKISDDGRRRYTICTTVEIHVGRLIVRMRV